MSLNSQRRKPSAPSRTYLAFHSAARPSRAPDGPCFRRRRDSSIRCSPPAFRSRFSASPGWPRSLNSDWSTPRFASRLQTYATQTEGELLATARLIAGLYANMDNFPVFVSLLLLYFAAASFSETARRLGRPHLAPSFLLHDHPLFGPACVRLFERARQVRTKWESDELAADILQAIEPFNVAGLGDPRSPQLVSRRSRGSGDVRFEGRSQPGRSDGTSEALRLSAAVAEEFGVGELRIFGRAYFPSLGTIEIEVKKAGLTSQPGLFYDQRQKCDAAPKSVQITLVKAFRIRASEIKAIVSRTCQR